MKHARFIFEGYTTVDDGFGGQEQTWATIHDTRGTVVYARGSEGKEAGALTGTATFKLRIRSCVKARALTTDNRVKDGHTGRVFNIREVDPWTDLKWVYIVAEGGVAV